MLLIKEINNYLTKDDIKDDEHISQYTEFKVVGIVEHNGNYLENM
ncbi:hypothetical protein [Clostridium tetanomorphum]|nr:hypothetical protein [Clostridium tetanomorphum]MBP1866617.1 hypothetical protein [Clostridium tetanomorphum]